MGLESTNLFRQASDAMEREDYDKALQLSLKALEQNDLALDNRLRLYVMIASCYYQQNNYEEAISWFEEAEAGADMADHEIYYYARSLYHGERYDEAARILDQMMGRMDDNASANHLRGLIEYNLDNTDFDKALNWLMKAAELDEDKAENFYIGDCLRLLERYEEAIPWYEKALSENPGLAFGYYYYGITLYFADRVNDAIASLQKAVKLDDTHQQSHLDLGRIYTGTGQKNEALHHIQRALELGHPEAKEALSDLAQSEFGDSSGADGGQESSVQTRGQGFNQLDEYYDSPTGYYTFPENEADKRIHPLIQKTENTQLHQFEGKLYTRFAGLILGLLFVGAAFFWAYEKVDEMPPTLDIPLKAHVQTEFSGSSVLSDGETALSPRISRGTALLPVAWYRGDLMVELPDGQRGLLPRNTIDRFYNVTIDGGSHIYDDIHGQAFSGRVDEDGAEGIVLSNIDQLDERRYRVRLDDGRVGYINRYSIRDGLRQLDIPTINRDNRRIYQIDHLNKKLAGADQRQVTRRLGIPASRINDTAAGRTVYLFPNVMIVDQGQRYPRAAVIMQGENVTQVLPQGEPKTVYADQFAATPLIQNLGLPNLYLQDTPWHVHAGRNWIDDLKDWSAWVGWIVHILVIIIIIALFLVVLYGFFSLPLLLAWPVALFMGTKTKLPNGFINAFVWVLMALLFIAFYFASIVTFNIQYGMFILGAYGVVLFFVFLFLTLDATSFINAVRCPDCKIWRCVRDLGSIYLGYDRSVTYEKVYTGSSTSGNVRTNYYEEQPRVSYTYYYQDFFGCRICGSQWSQRVSKHSKRGDMDHSRIPK